MSEYYKIISKLGVYNQQKKFAEEHFELQDAITRYEQLRAVKETDSDLMIKKFENIEEEIADNLVLLDQFIDFYGIDREHIEEIKENKVKRTLDRLYKL